MSPAFKIVSAGFVLLFGKRALRQKDMDDLVGFMRSTIQEKKAKPGLHYLAPTTKTLPEEAIRSLTAVARMRAAKKEEDGVCRWRGVMPEVERVAAEAVKYIRGEKIEDAQIRAALEFHGI